MKNNPLLSNLNYSILHNINYSASGGTNSKSINSLKNIYSIPVNQPLTDSLSLKIPLTDCTVLDERLTSMTAIYYETLDSVDSELSPPKPIVITWNGITCRFSLVEIPKYNKETKERPLVQYINLTVSAKLLKDRYFEGINLSNIDILHQTFMDFQVFECSLETFLSGMVSDIDVCINRYTSTPLIFSDILSSLVTQSGVKAKHLKLFNDKTNVGLNFNTRNFARPSLPFIKLYHKEFELLNKSAEFFNAYLQNYSQSITNLTRIEATIKNYDHKKRLEKYDILPKYYSLKEFLEIPQESLYKFVCFSLSSYIVQKPRLKAPNLSPSDHIIFELLQNCLESGYDFKQLLSVVDSFKGTTQGSTDVSRSRMRKKITELFDLLVFKDVKIRTKANHNAHVLDYLRFLQISV